MGSCSSSPNIQPQEQTPSPVPMEARAPVMPEVRVPSYEELQQEVQDLQRENQRLTQEAALLRRDCRVMILSNEEDAETIRNLTKRVDELTTQLHEEQTNAQLERQQALEAARELWRKESDELLEAQRVEHLSVLRTEESRHEERIAEYEEMLATMEKRLLAASTPEPQPVTPAEPEKVASPVKTSSSRPTSAKRVRVAPPGGEASSRSSPSTVEHCVETEGKRSSHVQEKLNEALVAGKLDSVASLYDFWLSLGGTTGWERSVTRRTLTSILSRCPITEAWLSRAGATSWCENETTFVRASELRGFVSVVLSRLPQLYVLGVHESTSWVFDWAAVDRVEGCAFPSLRRLFLSHVVWKTEQIFALCRELTLGNGGKSLEVIALDHNTADPKSNLPYIRQNCTMPVCFLQKPISHPLLECVPRLSGLPPLQTLCRTMDSQSTSGNGHSEEDITVSDRSDVPRK